MGTFCGAIIVDATNLSDAPLWCQAIGMVLGCLAGLVVAKAIVGSDSDNHGINRVNALNQLIGNLEKDELKHLILDKVTYFNHKTQALFSHIDLDGNSFLEVQEMRS